MTKKTKIIIEITTAFKPFFDEPDMDSRMNITAEIEKTFHDKMFEYIENSMGDELNENFMDNYFLDEWNLEGVEDISDLGSTEMKITQEDSEEKNDEKDDKK